jgi:hypothetical protein
MHPLIVFDIAIAGAKCVVNPDTSGIRQRSLALRLGAFHNEQIPWIQCLAEWL